MRVLLVSKACVVGAYQTKLEAIARDPDIELTVVVPPSWREKGNTLTLERVHTQGYELRIEPIRFNGQFHLFYFPHLGRLIRQLRPDVVHIDEEPYNLATYLAVRAAKRSGASVAAFTWQNLNRAYPWPFAGFERYVYATVDAIIAGNHQAVDVLRAKGYMGSAPVIPQFGVDELHFAPQLRALRPFTIGYAGRLVESKGLDTLMQALECLTGDWRLLVVGSGEMATNIESWAQERGLAERIELRSRVPSTEMPEVYNEMDVLVLPSRTTTNWMEQFGRVLTEAMSCEVPVVGSDSGEIPNVIGDAGLIFPEGDAAGLAERLQRLKSDRLFADSLGHAGRERVLQYYTQDSIARQTAAVYRGLNEASGLVGLDERGIIAS